MLHTAGPPVADEGTEGKDKVRRGFAPASGLGGTRLEGFQLDWMSMRWDGDEWGKRLGQESRAPVLCGPPSLSSLGLLIIRRPTKARQARARGTRRRD